MCVLALMSTGSKAKINMSSETECLALNVYHEARGESLAGKYAVSDVVLNRVESNRYPNTVCGVVKQARLWQGYPVRNQCQFSWYCDGRSDEPTDYEAWIKSVEVATYMMYDNRFRGITEGATHYHTNYVNPRWNRNMTLIGSIGDHIFYKGN